jgi:hypothetical protein
MEIKARAAFRHRDMNIGNNAERQLGAPRLQRLTCRRENTVRAEGEGTCKSPDKKSSR